MSEYRDEVNQILNALYGKAEQIVDDEVLPLILLGVRLGLEAALKACADLSGRSAVELWAEIKGIEADSVLRRSRAAEVGQHNTHRCTFETFDRDAGYCCLQYGHVGVHNLKPKGK